MIKPPEPLRRWSVRLLGSPRIEGPDGRVTGAAAQRHRIALIALLATDRSRLLSRERLIGFLWPEANTSAGRQLLNVSVYELRRTMGAEVVVSEGESLRLAADLIRVDTWDLDAALAEGQLEHAVELASAGLFLDGLSLPGAVEFDHWVDGERGRIERQHQEVLELLAERAEREGALSRAVHWWKERLVRTPADARIVQRLMTELDRIGDRAGALRVADAHALLLHQEYGLERDRDVESLSERLRNDRRPAQSMHVIPVAAPESRAEGVTIGHAPSGENRPGQADGGAPSHTESDGLGAPVPAHADPALGSATGSNALWMTNGSIRFWTYVPLLFLGLAGVALWQWQTDDDVSSFLTPAGYLTALQGTETDPEFSPSGDRVAFAWDSENGQGRQLFIVSVRGGDTLRLTDSAEEDGFPAWSPDGTEIAFLRSYEGGRSISPAPADCCRHDIMVMPALGGPIKRLTSSSWGQGLDWSPHGQLVFSDRPALGAPLRLFLISVETGERLQFTSTPSGEILHDTDGVFSPNGARIAFVRRAPDSGGRGSVYIQSVGSNDARRLTSEMWAWDIDWTPDGRALLLATGDPSGTYLARIPLEGGAIQPLAGGAGAFSIATSSATGGVVFAERFQDHDIWRIAGPSAMTDEPPRRLVSSTRDDFMPDFSPDGRRLAFVSAREGSWDVWILDLESGEEQRLTGIGNALFPRWSPDANRLVFSSLRLGDPAAKSDVYAVDLGSRLVENLTDDAYQDGIPSWSPDGKWIYFQSRQDSSGWQLRRKPVLGGADEPLLASPVLRPHVMNSGAIVYYVPRRGIWISDGGEPRPLLDRVSFWSEWTLWRDAVVFVEHADSGSTVQALDIETREIRPVVGLPNTIRRALRLPGSNLAVSPDGKWIAYTALQGSGSDLRIMR